MMIINIVIISIVALAGAVEGRIINISSLAGLRPTAQETTYGVAKAGVIQYTRCLAVQLRDQGINVNAIAPGQIKSARWLATIHTRQKAADLLDETRPLLRFGEIGRASCRERV